jgi:tetratricopeptide (TPR) repeat protein
LAALAPVFIGVALWVDYWVKKRAEVYRLEVRGDFYASKWTEPEIRKGIEYYNRAIVLDPRSAASYAGLAVGWNFLSDLHVPPREAMPRSKAAALKAIEIDETMANAHVSLGVAKMQYDWDWTGAEQEFKRAIAIDPTI